MEPFFSLSLFFFSLSQIGALSSGMKRMGEALKVVDENLAESPSCSQAEANHGDEGDGRSPKRRRSQGAEDALEVHFSSHSTQVFPHMPHKKKGFLHITDNRFALEARGWKLADDDEEEAGEMPSATQIDPSPSELPSAPSALAPSALAPVLEEQLEDEVRRGMVADENTNTAQHPDACSATPKSQSCEDASWSPPAGGGTSL
tara:strand:+ start:139 stop:747 length:609 start_codon:yes stop_codon:yes gene_type:complete